MTTVASPILTEYVHSYLAHWRALGRAYRQQGHLLLSLLRELPTLGHRDITSASFQCWIDAHQSLHPNSRRKAVQIIRHFCRWRQRSDPHCYVPGEELVCRAQPYVTPVILDDRHIVCMLRAADRLDPSPNSPLRPSNMRMAVVLLYTTGMRIGELQRLELGDVEDNAAVLRVRESKFHKSRMLPLSKTTQAELLAYLAKRSAIGFSTAPSAPLLCRLTRARGRTKPYSHSGLQPGISALLRHAAESIGNTSRPRVHDLRHSFAVQALSRWYRQGADVQAQLPKLAMYMGHVSIESTAYYLRWTEELAALASQRFAQHFAMTIGGQS